MMNFGHKRIMGFIWRPETLLDGEVDWNDCGGGCVS
jgi:hypothetical protein